MMWDRSPPTAPELSSFYDNKLDTDLIIDNCPYHLNGKDLALVRRQSRLKIEYGLHRIKSL